MRIFKVFFFGIIAISALYFLIRWFVKDAYFNPSVTLRYLPEPSFKALPSGAVPTEIVD